MRPEEVRAQVDHGVGRLGHPGGRMAQRNLMRSAPDVRYREIERMPGREQVRMQLEPDLGSSEPERGEMVVFVVEAIEFLIELVLPPEPMQHLYGPIGRIGVDQEVDVPHRPLLERRIVGEAETCALQQHRTYPGGLEGAHRILEALAKDDLLGRFRGTKPLSAWMEPITDLIVSVYDDARMPRSS
jgi:hypothetical protein